MAAIPEAVAANIRQYAADARTFEQGQMEVDSQGLETRLDQTIDELQSRLAQQRLELEQLRAQVSLSFATLPSRDRRERLRQLRTLKAAYDQVADDTPSLPSESSAIPALLATRLVQATVASTKTSISSVETQLTHANARLKVENAELEDARGLAAALEDRLARLRKQHEERSQKSASQRARETLKMEQRKRQDYEKESKALSSVLDDFVEEHLAGMLAAEELGGPVVGEMMDIDDADLAVGFSSQGRVKKGKVASEEKRQRRIDEIWGGVTSREDDEILDEKGVAAAEMKDLLKQLCQALLGQGESGAYVPLPRESAAARFLVRAKLAQYHPRDAKRLRLIDFGRELDQ